MVTIIVAHARNRVIGNQGHLPWHLSEDLKRFKSLTMGNPIVMGRKTFESIGKPLPGRTNIILSRNQNFEANGCLVYRHIEEVLDLFAGQNLFVIGGGEIYSKFLPYTDTIQLTFIDQDFEGDAFFPELGNSWKEISRESHKSEQFDYFYITLKKIGRKT